MIVEEGDNSPLPIVQARLLLPSYRLRFFREREAELRLVYGRMDLEAPRYDLALLAPQFVFWTVLVGAVLVIFALIVRLVRNQPLS